MAVRVELAKEIVKAALDQAASLRARNVKAATNELIKQALQQEEDAIRRAIPLLETITDPPYGKEPKK